MTRLVTYFACKLRANEKGFQADLLETLYCSAPLTVQKLNPILGDLKQLYDLQGYLRVKIIDFSRFAYKVSG